VINIGAAMSVPFLFSTPFSYAKITHDIIGGDKMKKQHKSYYMLCSTKPISQILHRFNKNILANPCYLGIEKINGVKIWRYMIRVDDEEASKFEGGESLWIKKKM
jgi:hypothetical protein